MEKKNDLVIGGEESNIIRTVGHNAKLIDRISDFPLDYIY